MLNVSEKGQKEPNWTPNWFLSNFALVWIPDQNETGEGEAPQIIFLARQEGEGKRPGSRPRGTWEDCVIKTLAARSLDLGQARILAGGRMR